MSQLADQHTREHLEGTPPTASHRALSALAKVTLGGGVNTRLASYAVWPPIFVRCSSILEPELALLIVHHVFIF